MRQDVAFDVSKQTSGEGIVDEVGKCLVRRKVRTDPPALAAFVGKHGRKVAIVGFEAGSLSTCVSKSRQRNARFGPVPVAGEAAVRARPERPTACSSRPT